MDTILPSTGPYKVSASINGATLDELSFFSFNDKIQPYFEESISKDPDVTALVVFLKNSRGNTVGWKVKYILERELYKETYENDNVFSEVFLEDFDDTENQINTEEETYIDFEEDELSSDEEYDLTPPVIETESYQPELNTDSYKDGDELIIVVKSLDGELPVFPLPDNLPAGSYTLVSQVMSGKNILQKIEKNIYYMGRTVFSYDGIQVYLPGITESSQVIPKGMVVLLETKLNFDNRLNPYIIWYNGRKKISEGSFSDGAGKLLWKAPEQSGFYSLRAEVFPVNNYNGLLGYQKDISLLVSSKNIEVNLISENITELINWYTFEGNLNDSKLLSSTEYALKPDAKNTPQWIGVNGTYGLVTGPKDIFSLPKVPIFNIGIETWQVLFRFKPLNNGVILSLQFDNSRDVLINLKLEDQALVLELISSIETVSKTYHLPKLSNSAGQSGFIEQSASNELSDSNEPLSSTGQSSSAGESNEVGQDSFITAEITFSIMPEMLAANISVVGVNKGDFIEEWIDIEIGEKDAFQILLGDKSQNINRPEAANKNEYTVIWDEFALYCLPPVEILDAEENEAAEEDEAVVVNKPVVEKQPQEKEPVD